MKTGRVTYFVPCVDLKTCFILSREEVITSNKTDRIGSCLVGLVGVQDGPCADLPQVYHLVLVR